MDWKLEGDRPIWSQLAEQLTRRIIIGTYPPGSKLPAVRELASEAGVNPNTMQRALAQLDLMELTKSDRTAGRTVTADQEIINQLRLAEAKGIMQRFINEMAELGYDKKRATELLEEEIL